MPIKIIIYTLSLLCLSAGARALGADIRLESELRMMIPSKLCVALILKNVSNEGFFIERAEMIYRGRNPVQSPFHLISIDKNRYEYTGPNNTLQNISYNGYTFIPAGRQDVSYFCFSEYYKLDEKIDFIYYEGIKSFYKVNNDGDMEYISSQDVKSNYLSIINYSSDSASENVSK